MSGPGPSLRDRVEQLLLWRVWERLLEIEFVDRSVALAGKAFVSFFPLVIVVAAFVPEVGRESIVTTLIDRLGLAGEALDVTRGAFDSSSDIREATGVLGLVLTVFFATSFTTALQRVYLRRGDGPIGDVGDRVAGGRRTALLMGLPLVFTIVVVNFVGGYIPYIGAFLGGGLAVVIALGEGGLPLAALMLLIVLAANLVLENFVEPKVMGRTLDIHPLVVLVVTALGGLLGGIVGLILAVPAWVIAGDAIKRLRSRGMVQRAVQLAEPTVKALLD
jgi:hypothetical protein